MARITPGINKSASMSATHSLEKVSRFMPYERVEYKIQKNNKFKIPLFNFFAKWLPPRSPQPTLQNRINKFDRGGKAFNQAVL